MHIQAEEKLKDERKRLFAILDALPAYVLLLKEDYSIKFANRYFQELYGKPKNKNCYEVCFNKNAPCENCKTFDVFKTKQPQKVEYSSFKNRVYEIFNYPFYDIDGTMMVLQLGLDVTERLEAEKIMQRYQLLFSNVKDIILMITPDGQIIEANRAAEASYGYKRHELLSLKSFDIVLSQDIEEHKAFIKRSMLQPVIRETLHKRKDGTTFPVEVLCQGAQIRDNAVIIAMIRDISERRIVEAELIKARETALRAEKLASLGTMAAGIAHEINQPLNSLKINADSMLYWHQRGKEIDINKIFNNIKKISDQATRIDEIIKHIRSFVRTDYNQKLVLCDLNQAVEGALGIIGSQLNSHCIMLEMKLEDNLPPVMAINTRLEEVVINLLINAMQALDTLNKKDKQISCYTFSKNNKVILEIADNGLGIDDYLLDKIFEPFFTTKPVGVGMGLGLSIAHSVVSSLKGEIDVANSATGGAVFKITFPAYNGS